MIRELVIALYIISTLFVLTVDTFSGVFIPSETVSAINSNTRISGNLTSIEGNITNTYATAQSNLGALTTNTQCSDPTCGNNYVLLLWNAMKSMIDMAVSVITAPFRLLDIVYELLVMVFPSISSLIGFVVGVAKTVVFFMIVWEIFAITILGRYSV